MTIFTVINLIGILFFGLLITKSIKHNILRGIISFIISLFIILQISSLYLGGAFIDYKYYIHFNIRDMIAMKELFTYQAALLTILMIGFSFLIYWLSYRINNYKLYINKYYKYPVIIIFIITLSINGGIFNNIGKIIKITTVKKQNFEVALKNLGMMNYIGPEEIIAEKGKNIIILSLESFEKGYLSKKFEDLTPNLRMLKEKWNYYEMDQSTGGGWTSGSLYMSLTGIPALFKGNHNKYFQKTHESYISGIGHILKKINYNQTFIIGNADFSGTKDLLNTYKIKNIIDYSQIKKGKDLDLFKEAKNILLSNKNNKKPFSVFISTMDTHGPNGIYDRRMERYIPPKSTNLEFMVASVDFMVGDFINFLEKEGFLKNTIVYIFPDHLKFGSGKMFRETGERGLYVLTNAEDKDISPYIKNELHQLDLPKIILSGAKIKHNVKFLIDYIGNKNKKDFISSHISEITALNNSGLIRNIEKEDSNIPINQ